MKTPALLVVWTGVIISADTGKKARSAASSMLATLQQRLSLLYYGNGDQHDNLSL